MLTQDQSRTLAKGQCCLQSLIQGNASLPVATPWAQNPAPAAQKVCTESAVKHLQSGRLRIA